MAEPSTHLGRPVAPTHPLVVNIWSNFNHFFHSAELPQHDRRQYYTETQYFTDFLYRVGILNRLFRKVWNSMSHTDHSHRFRPVRKSCAELAGLPPHCGQFDAPQYGRNRPQF
jgi:hypothetical protein